MFNIHWWHHVTNVELRRKAAISSLEYILYQRQLRWVGHIVRMPTNRLPRQLLYGKLRQGQRTVGRPKKRFADHLKCILSGAASQWHHLKIWQLTKVSGNPPAGLVSMHGRLPQLRPRKSVASGDMLRPLHRLLHRVHSVSSVDVSAPLNLASAAIYASTRRNRSNATSSSKSTDFHKQATSC